MRYVTVPVHFFKTFHVKNNTLTLYITRGYIIYEYTVYRTPGTYIYIYISCMYVCMYVYYSATIYYILNIDEGSKGKRTNLQR